MKKIFLTVIVLLLTAFYTPLVNAQTAIRDDTRTLILLNIDCKFAKGKVLGEKVRADVIVDGFEMNEPLSKPLKAGNIWNINAAYDYLEFINIRFWDDNVFKDNLITDLTFDLKNFNELKTVSIEGKDIQFDLTYKVVPGPDYRTIIMKLRQSLAAANEEIGFLKKINKELSDENDSLKTRNEDLDKELERLKEKK